MYQIITKLAGVTFGNCQENIKMYGYPSFSTYELRREIDNYHDLNAVRVGVGVYDMGYLPRHIAQIIAPMMDVGRSFIAEFVSMNMSMSHKTVGMTVRIVEIMDTQTFHI